MTSTEPTSPDLFTSEASALFEGATALRDQDRFAEARVVAHRALAALPPGQDVARCAVMREIGFTYQLEEDWERALPWYREASRLRPRSELSSLALCICLVNLHRFDDALDEALRFVKIKDSAEYRELFSTAFRDDVTVALREKADRVRAELAARTPTPTK